jgi:hypothetical protein
MRKSFIAIAVLFAFTGGAHAAVSIDTATQAELQTLNGINAAKAIIDYRAKAGAFKSTMTWKKWTVSIPRPSTCMDRARYFANRSHGSEERQQTRCEVTRRSYPAFTALIRATSARQIRSRDLLF